MKHGRRLLVLAAVFVVLFAVCLATVLPNGRATPLDLARVPANATWKTLIPQMGIEDAAHYLRVGHNIADLRGISLAEKPNGVSDRFVLSFWPPGMPFYYAALFTVFGPEMPVGVVAGAAMAFLWALLLTAFVDLLARAWSWFAATGMVVLVLLSNIMRDWILGPGVYWSEGLYTWCVLAAIYAATRAARARSDRTRLGWAAAVGAFLGLSAYVRNVSDLLGWLMLGLLIAWAGLAGLRSLVRRRRARRDEGNPSPGRPGRRSRHRPTWRPQLLSLLLCVLAFQVVTVPWRVYSAQHIKPGNYGWSTESNKLWHDSWTPDRVLRERHLGFLLDGGANTACHVDERTCRTIAAYELRRPHPYSGTGRYTEADYRRLAIRAAMHHPAEYGMERLRYLGTTWFWEVPRTRNNELLQNTLFAIAVVAGLALSVRRMRKSGPDLLALIMPGLFVTSLLPLVFIHFEARYFHALKLAGLVSVFMLVALDPVRRGARANAEEGERPAEQPVEPPSLEPVSAPP